MPIEVLRSKLISSGFHPEDVEYSMLEVLQYKKPESLDYNDFNIISGILTNRKRKSGRHKVSRSTNCYYFGE